MGIAHPNFPTSLWNGLSRNTARESITDDQWPNQQDWDQIVQEVIEVERYLLDNPLTIEDQVYQGLANTNLIQGQLIYVDLDSEIGLADSNNNLISGMALTSANQGETVVYVRRGRVTLADWTPITGSVSLAPGQDYFLTSTGSMSLTAPESG